MTDDPGVFGWAIMLAGGSALIVLGALLRQRRQRILQRARKTTGTVIDSDIRYVQDGYQPVVRYRYRADGQDRTGTRVTPPPGEETLTAGYKARRIAKAYPPGAQVTVYYLPDAPDTAFLRRGGDWMSMIPAGLGVALLVIAWQHLASP